MYESVIFTGGTQSCNCYRIIHIAYLFICFKGLASEKSIYQPCPCWVKVRIINQKINQMYKILQVSLLEFIGIILSLSSIQNLDKIKTIPKKAYFIYSFNCPVSQ